MEQERSSQLLLARKTVDIIQQVTVPYYKKLEDITIEDLEGHKSYFLGKRGPSGVKKEAREFLDGTIKTLIPKIHHTLTNHKLDEEQIYASFVDTTKNVFLLNQKCKSEVVDDLIYGIKDTEEAYNEDIEVEESDENEYKKKIFQEIVLKSFLLEHDGQRPWLNEGKEIKVDQKLREFMVKSARLNRQVEDPMSVWSILSSFRERITGEKFNQEPDPIQSDFLDLFVKKNIPLLADLLEQMHSMVDQKGNALANEDNLKAGRQKRWRAERRIANTEECKDKFLNDEQRELDLKEKQERQKKNNTGKSGVKITKEEAERKRKKDELERLKAEKEEKSLKSKKLNERKNIVDSIYKAIGMVSPILTKNDLELKQINNELEIALGYLEKFYWQFNVQHKILESLDEKNPGYAERAFKRLKQDQEKVENFLSVWSAVKEAKNPTYILLLIDMANFSPLDKKEILEGIIKNKPSLCEGIIQAIEKQPNLDSGQKRYFTQLKSDLYAIKKQSNRKDSTDETVARLAKQKRVLQEKIEHFNEIMPSREVQLRHRETQLANMKQVIEIFQAVKTDKKAHSIFMKINLLMIDNREKLEIFETVIQLKPILIEDFKKEIISQRAKLKSKQIDAKDTEILDQYCEVLNENSKKDLLTNIQEIDQAISNFNEKLRRLQSETEEFKQSKDQRFGSLRGKVKGVELLLPIEFQNDSKSEERSEPGSNNAKFSGIGEKKKKIEEAITKKEESKKAPEKRPVVKREGVSLGDKKFGSQLKAQEKANKEAQHRKEILEKGRVNKKWVQSATKPGYVNQIN